MQPCKILCGKLEINFSVLPLPSPCCLKPNTVQQHPLCLDPCQHQNFSLSKNSCQHLKICLASSWEQRKKCLRYHLIPPGSHALLRENPTETASPLATQTSRVNCSAQEVMQNSPSRSSFFFSPHNPIMFNWEIKSLEKCTFSLGNFNEFSPISMHSCCQPCPGSRGTHSTSSC